MRGALLVVPLLLSAAVARPARAESAYDLARATGHLLADDDLVVDRGFWTAPLEGGAFAVSTRLLLARTDSTAGRAVLWQAEAVVQIPLERWLGRRPRLPAMRAPLHALETEQTNADEHLEAHTMSSKVWKKNAALTAVVSGLSIAPSAGGQEKTAVAPPPLASPSAGSASGSASASAPAASPRLTAAGLRTLVAGALRQAGLDRDEVLDGLAARARWSALAPEVRLRALRSVDAGARVYRTDDVADRWTGSDGTSTLFEGRLSWRLDRLVFADEEVALERIRVERTELKQRITHRVIELATRWQRARRTAADPDALPRERDEAAAVEVESVVALDALTGGLATPILFHPTP